MPLLKKEEIAGPGVAPVEKQKLRQLAQGGTFRLADEIEAALRTSGMFAPDFQSFGKPTGETYEEAVSDIRGKLAAYQKEYPKEALAAEVAGGLLTAVPIAVATGGASVPPSLGRLALLGAGSTAAYEMGGGEGGLLERAGGVSPVSVGIGTALGPIAGLAAPALGRAATGLGKYVSGKFGAGAEDAVQKEVKRILERTGMDLDEVIERVSRGEIIPDMSDTTRDALRAYRPQITDVQRARLEARPAELRAKADVEVQSGLAPGMSGNVLAQARQGEEAVRKTASKEYDEIFKSYGDVSEEVMPRLNFAVQGQKKVVDAFNDITRTGKPSPFTVTESGGVSLNRTLSLREVEELSRAFRDLAGEAYRKGRSGAGDTYKELQLLVRGVADDASDSLRQTRAKWANIEKASRAFDEGRKAFNKSADEVELIFDEVVGQGDDAVQAFRAGLADNYRKKIDNTSGPAFRASLTNLQRRDAKVFAKVFPEDTYQETIDSLARSASSQLTMSKVLRGSDTAPTQQEALQQGKDILQVGGELAAAKTGSGMAVARLANRVVSKFVNKDKLTEAQKRRVVEILVSEDPELLSRALKDSSLMARVTQRAGQISNAVSRGAVLPAGAVAGGNE